MAKRFRTFSGAQNFSPELRAQIQKSHELSDEGPRQIGDSDWSQVMRFMKKFDIPPCLLGLGAFLSYVIGPAFSELICNKMDTNKEILDVCCGGRMFWFDKHNPDVLFSDIREEEHLLCDGRFF